VAASVSNETRRVFRQSPRQPQVLEVLLVAADEARDVPGRPPLLLATVELGVVDSRQVFEVSDHRWRQPGPLDANHCPSNAIYGGRRFPIPVTAFPSDPPESNLVWTDGGRPQRRTQVFDGLF